jgi:TrmH family RNA methyltransferase
MNRQGKPSEGAEVITSRHNAVVREARAARDGKTQDLIFIEGLRLCEEAARCGLDIRAVLFTEKFLSDERASRLINALSATAERVLKVSDELIEHLSDTRNSQGVITLARRPATTRASLESLQMKTPLVVIMHRVNNPANAGAMLRVAEAAGATSIITTRHTTDLFSPKALRGAMGSSFRLPVWTGAEYEEALRWCAERGIKTVSTHLDARHTHTEIDWTVPRAVVVGPEAAGLNESEALAASESIRIPMRPPVESLNVAVALALVIYEAARQRGSF